MRIRYVGIDGGLTRLTLDEFLQFSQTVRAVLVCEGLITFYDHRSRPIQNRAALVELSSTWNDEFDVDLEPPTLRPSSGAPTDAASDRRRHARHSMVVPLSVTSPDRTEVAFTENISQGGVLFRSPNPYCAGDKIRVSIPVAGVAEAVVIRSSVVDEGCLTAVAFMQRFEAAA